MNTHNNNNKIYKKKLSTSHSNTCVMNISVLPYTHDRESKEVSFVQWYVFVCEHCVSNLSAVCVKNIHVLFYEYYRAPLYTRKIKHKRFF